MSIEATQAIEPWLLAWCRREIVVKARPDPTGRVATCLAMQHAVARAGLPCARPLTEATTVDGLAVHAEEWRPGGEIARGTDAGSAEQSARFYASVTAVTSNQQLPPPLPNPEWVHWDHDGPGQWPPNDRHDCRPGADSLRLDLVAVAARARKRLLAAASMRPVLGHADWEAQNLRWQKNQPYVVHDWDSLAWLPEPALHNGRAVIL